MRNIELIMVSADNNNKFYKMVESADGKEFTITYGRIGQSGTSETYPINRWNSKYREKIKKGYKDVTEFKRIVTDSSLIFEHSDLELFYTTFEQYSSNSVKHNYQISSDSVTPLMIKEAQGILDFMLDSVNAESLDNFNKGLIDLFTILPRKIRDVRKELYTSFDNSKLIDRISKEQDVLDSLDSQIISSVSSSNNLGKTSINDLFNCQIEPVTAADRAILEGIINPTNTSKHKIFKGFKITHNLTQPKFDKWLSEQSNKSCKYLIHGTRNTSVFSILKSGLVLRPTNAVFSGSIYGKGIYHSFHADKSLGYTGYDNDKVFFIQNVHMGNHFTYNGWYRDGKGLSSSQMNYPYLKSQGYDSLYVAPGDGLRNSEYIVYNEEQTTTNFLVWLK